MFSIRLIVGARFKLELVLGIGVGIGLGSW